MNRSRATRLPRQGFCLVELPQLLVMLIVIVVFAGVPSLLHHYEQDKAADALDYLSEVHRAQEEYRLLHGIYASDIAALDMPRPAPAYFALSEIKPVWGHDGLEETWSLRLTRMGGRTSGYGQYTITFTQAGFDAKASSLASSLVSAR